MGRVLCSELEVPWHGSSRYQSLCIWCELVCVLFKLVDQTKVKIEQTMVEVEVRRSDLHSYLAVANKLLGRQQSEMGVVIEHMQVLRDFFQPTNLPEEHVTANGEGVYKLRRTSSGTSWSWKSPTFSKPGARPEVGAKKRSSDSMMFQQYPNGCSAISRIHVASKKVKIVGPYPDSSTFTCQFVDNDMILGDTSCKRVASGILSSIVGGLRGIPRVRSWFPTRRFVQVGKPTTTWESLPADLHVNILQRVELKDLFRFKILSKSSRECIERDALIRQCRGAEGLFTAINYHMKNKQWRCSGFDLRTRMWKALPSLSPALPAPDPELFKEYSVCGHGGLVCADVAKLPEKGKLVLLNPLTQKKRELPPLLHPRSPVLIHMWVDSDRGSFKVVVAGSSASSDEKLSRKMELFDSETSVWEAVPDLPGPAFGLNEHQVGVCADGVLHFIAFLDDSCDGRRGVVAFDLKTKTWLSARTCPISFAKYSNTLQLVESTGKVCLFSEQELGVGSVDHCIDVLELVDEKWKLQNVVRVKKCGGRGLQVYPEHTCVSFEDEKLCIFNTLTRSGVVYDMRDGKEVEALEAPPLEQELPGDNFFTLNPASFVLQPSFDSDRILEKTIDHQGHVKLAKIPQ